MTSTWSMRHGVVDRLQDRGVGQRTPTTSARRCWRPVRRRRRGCCSRPAAGGPGSRTSTGRGRRCPARRSRTRHRRPRGRPRSRSGRHRRSPGSRRRRAAVGPDEVRVVRVDAVGDERDLDAGAGRQLLGVGAAVRAGSAWIDCSASGSISGLLGSVGQICRAGRGGRGLGRAARLSALAGPSSRLGWVRAAPAPAASRSPPERSPTFWSRDDRGDRRVGSQRGGLAGR